MTEQTRRSVLRYGIAVDLVILATGVAMLSAAPDALLLIVSYGVAVALSAFRGGWKGAAVALALSLVIAAVSFPEAMNVPSVMGIVAAGMIGGGAVAYARRPRAKIEAEVEAEEPVPVSLRLVETGEREPPIPRPTVVPPDAPVMERQEEREQRTHAADARSARDEKRRKKEEKQREAIARELAAKLEAEKQERQRAEEERARAEAEKRRAEEERERVERELAAKLEAERIAAAAAQRRAAEELEARLAQEREALRLEHERELAAERERLTREAAERAAAEREAAEREAAERAAAAAAAAAAATSEAVAKPALPAAAKPVLRPAPKTSLVDTVSGWFARKPQPRLATARTAAAATKSTPARPQARPVPQLPTNGKPRLLMLERRRATADTVIPKIRQRGVEVTVVERWVDAVDEMFRLKPHVIFLDVEHPEFGTAHRTLTEKSPGLPIVLTGRAQAFAPTGVSAVAFMARPYEVEPIVKLAAQAHVRPSELLAQQTKPQPVEKSRQGEKPKSGSAPLAVVPKPARPREEPLPVVARPATDDEYEVICYSCRAAFNAMDADWCSCLAKERTLVCTNCLSCFCKAPPAYKEKLWLQAPPRLFERKNAGGRKPDAALPPNPPKEQVTRPLVLVVEDDEDIQLIVRRVCGNLGYGFVHATNGQDGLEMARTYKPNLILTDAFMPKLDGREMCRILRDEADFADCRMVVMTGLYTDTKYRSEAVKRFHVDDYIAKPVAVTDLINLLQRHLEGVTGLPLQDDLHEMHRADMESEEGEGQPSTDDVPLADILSGEATRKPAAAPSNDEYRVDCVNCSQTFDATRADWCKCVGRDNTLVCHHCGGCFCKAAPAWRERFWTNAPPSLFERKMIGSKRNVALRINPAPDEVKRPLILLVEDDENVQLIVKTVVSSMGFGFVVGANGQEGLSLAREYQPDLILSDAFMPKLDGREMCRLLKQDPATAGARAIIMTGLYTDRKYRNEALDYFKVDDYVAKPLAVDDLIRLFKKHLPQEAAAS